jgi:hypothetical protein
LLGNEITDSEDDGRQFHVLSFEDHTGQKFTFHYMWSPWDGNDYDIFASPEDAVRVQALTPTDKMVDVPAITASPAPRAPVTHTLAEVKHLPAFRDAVVDLNRRWKQNMPPTTLHEGKNLARAVAEQFGLSDRDMIDVILKPRLAGIRAPKAAATEMASPSSANRRPRRRRWRTWRPGRQKIAWVFTLTLETDTRRVS